MKFAHEMYSDELPDNLVWFAYVFSLRTARAVDRRPVASVGYFTRSFVLPITTSQIPAVPPPQV